MSSILICNMLHMLSSVILLSLSRQRLDFGMLQDPLMTMSDENLATFIAEFRTVTPSAGESLVSGSLRSQGYHVTRERVREALRSSDPLGSVLRWPGVSTPLHMTTFMCTAFRSDFARSTQTAVCACRSVCSLVCVCIFVLLLATVAVSATFL